MSNDISDGCLYVDSLMAAMLRRSRRFRWAALLALLTGTGTVLCTARTQHFTNGASALPMVPYEAQPLAANIERLDQALEYLAAPFPAEMRAAMKRAGQARD